MGWVRRVGAGLGGIALVVVLICGYSSLSPRRLAREVEALQKEREQLLEYARRLSASRRVGQVNVMEQFVNSSGQPTTRLLWQEVGSNGLVSLPVEVEVIGTLVYFEAFVIKFDYELVGGSDPERGTSIALFRRIFGDLQVPEEAPMLDGAGSLPAEAATEDRIIEEELWHRFWDLVDDTGLATRYGVRVAQCEAPAVPLRSGQVWQVTLDAPGGLNLKKVRDYSRAGYSVRAFP